MMPKTPKRVGYILKKFPTLSETFILNEILALEAEGIPVHIFSLERSNDPCFHENIVKLKALISYVPSMTEMEDLWKHQRRAASQYKENYRQAFRYALKHYTTPSLLWRFFQSCYIANETKRYGIGHFHAHFATRPTSVAFLSSMITDIPFSFTAHAMDIYKTQLSPKALSKKIDRANFIITVSDYNKQFLEGLATNGVDKIQRIYNGIDLNFFQPNGQKAPLPFIFLSVARLVEKKGHLHLIEACGLLRDEGLAFKCWLIGKGKLRGEIEKKIKELNLHDTVELLGPLRQEEVLKNYHKAHALVLPCQIGSDGNRDGLPVSITEALACGLPVITTPMTGIPEVVRHGQNGLLVSSGDAQALAQTMRQLLEDRGLYEKLKSRARSSVEKSFDCLETTKRLVELFRGSLQ